LKKGNIVKRGGQWANDAGGGEGSGIVHFREGKSRKILQTNTNTWLLKYVATVSESCGRGQRGRGGTKVKNKIRHTPKARPAQSISNAIRLGGPRWSARKRLNVTAVHLTGVRPSLTQRTLSGPPAQKERLGAKKGGPGFGHLSKKPTNRLSLTITGKFAKKGGNTKEKKKTENNHQRKKTVR